MKCEVAGRSDGRFISGVYGLINIFCGRPVPQTKLPMPYRILEQKSDRQSAG